VGIFWLMFGNKIKGGYVAVRTVSKLSNLLNPDSKSITSGSGTFVVDYSQGNKKKHAEIDFAFRKPECYRLKFKGDLFSGDLSFADGLQLVAGKEKMYVYKKKGNIVFIGDPSLPMWRVGVSEKKETKKAQGCAASHTVFAGVALAQSKEAPAKETPPNLTKYFSAEYKGIKMGPNGSARLLVVHPKPALGKDWEKAEIRIWIQDFVPTAIEVDAPQQKLNVILLAKDLKLNLPLGEDAFSFAVPKGAKTQTVPRKQIEKVISVFPSIMWDILR